MMGNDGFVTNEECEERRKCVFSKICKNADDIVDLKILAVQLEAGNKANENFRKAILAIFTPILVAIFLAVLL